MIFYSCYLQLVCFWILSHFNLSESCSQKDPIWWLSSYQLVKPLITFRQSSWALFLCIALANVCLGWCAHWKFYKSQIRNSGLLASWINSFSVGLWLWYPYYFVRLNQLPNCVTKYAVKKGMGLSYKCYLLGFLPNLELTF